MGKVTSRVFIALLVGTMLLFVVACCLLIGLTGNSQEASEDLALGEGADIHDIRVSLIDWEASAISPAGDQAPAGSRFVVLWLQAEAAGGDTSRKFPVLSYHLERGVDEIGRPSDAFIYSLEEDYFLFEELWPGVEYTGWRIILVPQAASLEGVTLEITSGIHTVGRWRLE